MIDKVEELDDFKVFKTKVEKNKRKKERPLRIYGLTGMRNIMEGTQKKGHSLCSFAKFLEQEGIIA